MTYRKDLHRPFMLGATDANGVWIRSREAPTPDGKSTERGNSVCEASTFSKVWFNAYFFIIISSRDPLILLLLSTETSDAQQKKNDVPRRDVRELTSRRIDDSEIFRELTSGGADIMKIWNPAELTILRDDKSWRRAKLTSDRADAQQSLQATEWT